MLRRCLRCRIQRTAKAVKLPLLVKRWSEGNGDSEEDGGGAGKSNKTGVLQWEEVWGGR